MQDLKALQKIASKVIYDMPLKRMTTYRVGGPTRAYVEIDSITGMQKLLQFIRDYQLSWMVLGLGSNLLVSDRGYDGIIVKLKGEFEKFHFDDNRLVSGSGVGLMRLAREAQRRGLSGLEFASGIPGTIGGAVVMNAGAHGKDISGIITQIEAFDSQGTLKKWRVDEVNWEYRGGFLNSRCIITTIFKLNPSKVDRIKKTMDNYLSVRNHSQPKGFSAGSVFRNPEGRKAWKLIQEAGFQGYHIGDAMVSEKHANFIINRKNASASDIYRLIREIQAGVFEKFGIRLRTEVRMIGDFE